MVAQHEAVGLLELALDRRELLHHIGAVLVVFDHAQHRVRCPLALRRRLMTDRWYCSFMASATPPGWVASLARMAHIYDVPGISCDRCKVAIESELAGLDGRGRVVVDITARTVEVDGPASVDAVRAAIDDAGYEVAAVR